eukprot:Gb_27544 [translate_table: standard]
MHQQMLSDVETQAWLCRQVHLWMVENLSRRSQLQEVELERTAKQLKEAIAIAREETAKCKAAKEVIKSLTAQGRLWIALFSFICGQLYCISDVLCENLRFYGKLKVFSREIILQKELQFLVLVMIIPFGRIVKAHLIQDSAHGVDGSPKSNDWDVLEGYLIVQMDYNIAKKKRRKKAIPFQMALHQTHKYLKLQTIRNFTLISTGIQMKWSQSMLWRWNLLKYISQWNPCSIFSVSAYYPASHGSKTTRQLASLYDQQLGG